MSRSTRKLVLFMRVGGAASVFAILAVAQQLTGQNGRAVEKVVHQSLARQPQFQGAASCAMAACHHANGPRGSPGSEFTTWVLHDPHARAYEVLLAEKSQSISAHLGSDVPAHKNPRCLNCHVGHGIAEAPRHERFALTAGVSCEACHGAAEHWLHQHYRKTDKRRAGMRETRDLRARAELCVGCHVGLPGCEVNHDLIAAGHPPLRFELAAYLANYPRHWPAQNDSQPRAWLIGQMVTAQAWLQCLKARTEDASPWPEFADYDCFRCHHDLRSPAWRQAPANLHSRSGGLMAANPWYLGALPALAPGDSTSEAIDRFNVAMNRPSPRRSAVREGGKNLVRQLDAGLELLASHDMADARIAEIRGQLQAQIPKSVSWDETMHLYLGLSALAGRGEEAKDVLKELQKKLDVPCDYDSPRDFIPGFMVGRSR